MTLARSCVVVSVVVLVALGCSGRRDESTLVASMPLHLEDHLQDAMVEGSQVPPDLPESVVWTFDVEQPDWARSFVFESETEPARLEQRDDSLRLWFDTERNDENEFVGGIVTQLPGWRVGEWAHVAVRARAQPEAGGVCLGFNLSEPPGSGKVEARGECARFIADGTEQTYLLRAAHIRSGELESDWRELVLMFWAREPTSVDILSVSVIPREATFAGAPLGLADEIRGQLIRRSIFVHTPARIDFMVEVPTSGRLDLGLGVVRDSTPIRFRVTAGVPGSQETLLDEIHADSTNWNQHSIDLSGFAGKTITVGLSAESESLGAVALWGAPTLSGRRVTQHPNVILYVIDGAAAEQMSLYGYHRANTPTLDSLAQEGVVFDWAFSNSSWTRPSTLSFLTGLQHSTLGGLRDGRNAPPVEVDTAAERLHRAGYQTGFFTTNPNAGTMSGLGGGVDVMREAGVPENRGSSSALQDHFWQWREAYPGEPYWAHIQTTEVHSPNRPEAPFAGTWASPDGGAVADDWVEALETVGAASTATPYSESFEAAGIERSEYFALMRDLYDETMLQQDRQIGQLVDRLKESGEWDRTLLIIASDHSHAAGTRHFGLGLLDPLAPIWEGAMASSFQSHIPLIFIWPGRINAGLRLDHPVSMIDVLPTVLELLDLPPSDYLQGRSLAPLLLGEDGWNRSPVILDEFNVDEGEWRGQIEMIDGRWAASLYVGPPNPDDWLHLRGHREVPPPGSSFREDVPGETPRLLLYDLQSDPHTLRSVHAKYPELVEKYTRLLEAELRSNRDLARRFTRQEDSALVPEQLETLRALGYIQ